MNADFIFPLSIMLEPTDLCQCRCWMCPRSKTADVHQLNTSKPHFLTIPLFKKILDDLSSAQYLKLDTLFFHWIGEPFLHPKYGEFLDVIRKYYQTQKLQFKAVETHTNGILLDKTLLPKIFSHYQAGFPWILSFSVDAINPNTYKKVRGRDSLRKIYTNIATIIKEREARKWKYPKIILQFIVQKENFAEILPFYKYWKTFFQSRNLPFRTQFYFQHHIPKDSIFFRTLDYGSAEEQQKNLQLHQKAHQLLAPFLREKKGHKQPVPTPIPESNHPQLPQEKNTSTQDYSNFPQLCTCLWQSLAIRWDGNVNLICDIENSMPLGNVKTENLEKIFLTGIINKYRNLHWNGQGAEIEKCKLCGAYLSPNSGTIQDEKIIQFFRQLLKK